MLLSAAMAVMLVGVMLHGGTTTAGTSTGAATTGMGTGIGTGTGTGTGSSDTGSTSAATTGTGTTTGSSTGTTTSTDDTSDDASASATAPDPDAGGSSDAGVDPTFGPLDDTGTAGFDDDQYDGCCDHEENNSDNFLCRLAPTRFDRLAITVLLLLLGRPRRRGKTTGAP